MNILIIGGAGYIGSTLLQLIDKENNNIVVFDNYFHNHNNVTYRNNSIPSLDNFMDRENVVFYNEDVTSWSDNLMREISKSDVIIPLAALVGAPLCDKHPKEAMAINQKFIQDLAIITHDQLIIYPNSNSGYGSVNGICTEETPTNPLSLYGETKQNAEEFLLKRHKNSIVFRLATVFGVSTRTRVDLLVNDMVRRSLEGPIELFDSGFNRNYINVYDVARAFLFAIENRDKMVGQVFNVGADNLNMTKKELVSKICEVSGGTFYETDTKTDPDKRDYIISSEKIKKIGFTPLCNNETKFRQSIDELIHFYKNVAPEDMTPLRNY